ncbi:B12-binding domain-containing protein [Candidatus Riflebacteria bacterium]
MEILEQISEFLQQGEDEKVLELTKKAIDQKISPEQILNRGLLAGMDVIGEQFKKHEIFLPDVLLAAKAMHAGMEPLKPILIKEGIPSLGKVVLGTVKGDLHDIGKNLVGIMLKGAGYEIVDLGKDVAPEKFVETAIAENAQVIGLSTLLTTTMPMMKKTIEVLKEKSTDGKIKTIVGGAPISKEFAAEIGADAYGYDAANAVETVKKLFEGN